MLRHAGGTAGPSGLQRQWNTWLPEAALLAILSILVTLVFAFSPLDTVASRLFYRPNAADHWRLAHDLPWAVLYRAAPWITASLVLSGLGGLAVGMLRRQRRWRRWAIFLLLSVVVGPGLLINAVFKDHWDRPRPREVVEFGGPLQYVPAPLPGREGGASFPCGHCSVGFLYGAGWWIWRRRRPAWARISIAVGLIAGVGLGLGRMAAGAHFLSDVLWAGLLAYGVCHILYYHVLHLQHEESAQVAALGSPAGSIAMAPGDGDCGGARRCGCNHCGIRHSTRDAAAQCYFAVLSSECASDTDLRSDIHGCGDRVARLAILTGND